MSLENAKLPSLKDKLAAAEEPKIEVEKKVKPKVEKIIKSKGRK